MSAVACEKGSILPTLEGPRTTWLWTDPGYPECLSEINNPVECLHIVGDTSVLEEQAIAIVGARKATPYGLKCAYRFGMRAARAGLVVVSGGAIGCDQAAHRGALEGGGRAVVVTGCGANIVYPVRGRKLFEEVLAAKGAVVSEAPWDAPPVSWAFPRRNRIIAALSQAILIVEAGLPSGTFSTADAALAQGKDVLVVPGSIDSRESRGSNRLLQQGATPIVSNESFDDALEAIFGRSMERQATHAVALDDHNIQTLSETEEVLLRACAACPMHAEELASACALDVLTTIRLLSALELGRRVKRLRDGRYSALL